MSNKIIALYGGSFNPVANSHISLANSILEKFNKIEKVIFMPVSSKYNKKGLIDNEHRYNMLKLACNNNPKFEVSRIEIDFSRQLYTIETLEILEKQYPEYDLWFIIGTDNLKELNTWKRPEDLMSKYKILVLSRNESNIDEIINNDVLLSKYRQAFVKVDNMEINISSSAIREKIKNNEDIEKLIPQKVKIYIKENNLYKEKRC